MSSSHQYGSDANLLNKAHSAYDTAKEKVSSGTSRVAAGPGAEQEMSDELREMLAADPSLSCWPPEVGQAGSQWRRDGHLPSEET